MLVQTVIYTFPQERAGDAQALLVQLSAASRAEPGCVAFDVSRVNDKPNVFILHEVWKDQAALDFHYATDHFSRFGINGIRPLAVERVAYLATDI